MGFGSIVHRNWFYLQLIVRAFRVEYSVSLTGIFRELLRQTARQGQILRRFWELSDVGESSRSIRVAVKQRSLSLAVWLNRVAAGSSELELLETTSPLASWIGSPRSSASLVAGPVSPYDRLTLTYRLASEERSGLTGNDGFGLGRAEAIAIA